MNVVISPHLDDAVLSYGGAIGATARRTRVVTVLAGYPPEWSWPTPFDNASGFDDSRMAVRHRRAEDGFACSMLDVEPVHLGFLDGQYGPRNACVPDAMTYALRWVFERADDVIVPLGIAHPDHRLVAKCCRRALRELGRSCIIYADLPGAVLNPTHIPGAIRGWERAGFAVQPLTWKMNLNAKHRAWECYRSQHNFPELAWSNLIEEFGWRATFAA